MRDNYFRNATVRRVIDGDTIELDIDLGFDLTTRERVRLSGIDTPEIHRPRCEAEREHGFAARDFVNEWCIGTGNAVVLESQEFDRGKYGRILGDLWAGERSLTDALLVNGFAKRESYDG